MSNDLKVVSWSDLKRDSGIRDRLREAVGSRERLEGAGWHHVTHASNLVFIHDNQVIKIFPPSEQGRLACQTEVQALTYFQNMGLEVPRLIGKGTYKEGQDYDYLILSCLKGVEFSEVEGAFTDGDKHCFGGKMRQFVEDLNQHRLALNHLDFYKRAMATTSWDTCSDTFKAERIDYIKGLKADNLVWVHGDINPCNILLDKESIQLIDFADGLMAPKSYEAISVVAYLFAFEGAYLKGFFKNESLEQQVDLCLEGLLIHEEGPEMIRCNIGIIEDFVTLEDLKDSIRRVLVNGCQADQGLAYILSLREEPS